MKFQVRRKYRSPEARWVQKALQKTHETTRESSGGSAPGARLPPTLCAAAAAITLPARCVGRSDETAHGGCPGQGAGRRARTRRAHCVAESGESVVRLTRVPQLTHDLVTGVGVCPGGDGGRSARRRIAW